MLPKRLSKPLNKEVRTSCVDNDKLLDVFPVAAESVNGAIFEVTSTLPKVVIKLSLLDDQLRGEPFNDLGNFKSRYTFSVGLAVAMRARSSLRIRLRFPAIVPLNVLLF